MRFMVGLAESPSFPGNARLVAAWFPGAERGTASAIFNSAQYFSLVVFAPLMGWLVHSFDWHSVFFVMGGLGIVAAVVFWKLIHSPVEHPGDQQGRARLHRGRRRPDPHGGQVRHEVGRLHLAQRQPGADQPHADRRLHRPVRHQRADLFLRHLVPDLSGQGARPDRSWRPASPPPPRPCAASSAACSAASSRTACSRRPAR